MSLCSVYSNRIMTGLVIIVWNYDTDENSLISYWKAVYMYVWITISFLKSSYIMTMKKSSFCRQYISKTRKYDSMIWTTNNVLSVIYQFHFILPNQSAISLSIPLSALVIRLCIVFIGIWRDVGIPGRNSFIFIKLKRHCQKPDSC